MGGPPELVEGVLALGPLGSLGGRERELGVLRTALADAAVRGVAVIVRGQTGSGKTAMLRELARSLGDTATVLEGRCFERQAVPFKMFEGVVDALAAALVVLAPAVLDPLVPRELASLVRVFPVLRRVPRFSELAGDSVAPVDPQELRRRGFHALKALLASMARVRPVVIIIDDAHWGDTDSAGFLAELIHAAAPGVLVIAAHRPEDYLGMIARLRRPPGSGRGPLVPGENGPPADLRALEVDPLAVDHGGAPPLTMAARVRARIARLTPDAHALLAVSAVAARPIAIAIAAHAAGVTDGLAAASLLAAEHLASVRDEILDPAPDHVRRAVMATLDTETKAAWHEALARAFEAVQGEDQLDSQAVVLPWLAAGYPATAAHHAVGAALAAEAAFAFRRAAELYELALAFGPWDASGQRDLLRRKAYAFVCAGQLDEAATVYEHAAHLLDDLEALDLERLRVEALLRRGRLDEALPAAEALLAQIGIKIPLGTRASRTRLATQWVQMKLRGLDYVEREAAAVPVEELLAVDVLYSIASGLAFADPAIGRVVQSELVKAALDAGEPTRVCLALAQEVCYAAAAGTRNRGAVDAVARRLKAIAGRHQSPQVLGFADTALGIATHMSGRWRDARGHLEAGLQGLRDHGAGVRWEIDLGDTFWLASLFYLGDWAAFTEGTLGLLREALDRSDPIAQLNLRIGRCNLAWLVLDRPEEARAQLALAQAGLSSGFHLPHVSVMTAATAIALYTGAPGAALARIDEAWPHVERIGCLRLQQPRIELVWLRARALIADESSAPGERLREARKLGDELLGEGAVWAAALGHLVRACVHAWSGAERDARGELLAAEDQLAAAGMAAHLAVARMRRGASEGGDAGTALAAAARAALVDLGAKNPEAMVAHLAPWPR